MILSLAGGPPAERPSGTRATLLLLPASRLPGNHVPGRRRQTALTTTTEASVNAAPASCTRFSRSLLMTAASKAVVSG